MSEKSSLIFLTKCKNLYGIFDSDDNTLEYVSVDDILLSNLEILGFNRESKHYEPQLEKILKRRKLISSSNLGSMLKTDLCAFNLDKDNQIVMTLYNNQTKDSIVIIPDNVINILGTLQCHSCKVIGGISLQFCSIFNRANLVTVDLSDFTFGDIFDASRMFCGFKVHEIDLSNHDLTKFGNMDMMFEEAEINKVVLGKHKLPKCISMIGMFKYAKIKYLDLSGLVCENLGLTMDMFAHCICGEINLKGFYTGNVTKMFNMFYMFDCDALDLSDFNTINVTDMSNMFAGCNVKRLDLSSFDTTGCINFSSMFNYFCGEYLDLSSFSTDGARSFSDMFNGIMSHNLDIDLSNFVFGDKVVAKDMFRGSILHDVKLPDIPSGTYTDMFHNAVINSLSIGFSGKVDNVKFNFMFKGSVIEKLSLRNFKRLGLKNFRQILNNGLGLALLVSDYDNIELRRLLRSKDIKFTYSSSQDIN